MISMKKSYPEAGRVTADPMQPFNWKCIAAKTQFDILEMLMHLISVHQPIPIPPINSSVLHTMETSKDTHQHL